MAKGWQLLFRRGDRFQQSSGDLPVLQRPARDGTLSVADWVEQQMAFNGNTYGLHGGIVSHGVYGNKQQEVGEDYSSLANGAYKSSGVVFACCQARATVFSEGRFVYQKIKDERPGDFFGGPSLDILNDADLLPRAMQDADLAGNHFAVRKGSDIYRLRPDWVTIVLREVPEKATFNDIEGYLYRPSNTRDRDLWEYFPVSGENGAIAHWAPIPDPENEFRGMSWMQPIIRELMTDKAIQSHKLKFFEQGTVPGLVFSFKETVTPEEFQEFMRVTDETKSGMDNAYENLYLGGGADVSVVGAQALDFKALGSVSENRIASAARVHPSLVGLSDGLMGSSLNAGNYESAKHHFGDGTIRPLWRSLCGAYKVLIDMKPDARLWIDDRDVAFLREDQERKARTQQLQATTISRYVMQGYTPDSTVRAVVENNLELLEHTGLYSVQLLPPDVSHPTGAQQDPAGAGKAEPGKTKPTTEKPGEKPAPGEKPTEKKPADKNPDGSKKVTGSDKQVGPYRKPQREDGSYE